MREIEINELRKNILEGKVSKQTRKEIRKILDVPYIKGQTQTEESV